MWLVALLGMATKYAECLLAVKYRVRDKNGFMAGGPMYYIERGLGIKMVSKIICIIWCDGGLFRDRHIPQVNAITHAMQDTFNIPVLVTAIIVTLLVGLIILGGVKRIATASSVIVPFMAILYVTTSLVIILLNIEKVPDAILLIIDSAFDPQAALGGAVGFYRNEGYSTHVARGIFSNESGLGKRTNCSCSGTNREPVRQGLISMTGTFLDTIIVCDNDRYCIGINGSVEQS